MSTVAIIYHDSDFDGKLSNEVCRHWLTKLYPESKVHSYGWDYGLPVPEIGREIPSGPNCISQDSRMMTWEDYEEIYIVDLSVDELMAREELRSGIVWIDHHASAIKKWEGTEFNGYRIDGVAACRLCWQWFRNLSKTQ